MGHGLDVEAVALCCQQLPERGVARELVFHVADEVRQFVAGVDALEMRAAEHVVVGVDQPVSVEHDNGVDAELTAASADLVVPVDGSLPKALARARQFGQVHGRYMGNLGSESEFAHGNLR
ncbi:hypothetical protein D3C81_1722240 [compost metagenome]